MGLKAGWVALFIFVWVIGAFLGSTFDYQSAEASTGESYNTGTATFTNADDVVSSGGAAVWVVAMEDGNIQATDDAPIWSKIEHVGAGHLTNRTGVATGSPLTLAVGANVVPITRLGAFTIVLPDGNTGTATSVGGCVVTGSPVDLVGVFDDVGGLALGSPITLVVGVNTITVTGLGTFSIVLPDGNTGTATSVAPCIVDGSPVALVAGNNTINTSGAIGTITIDVGGTSIITTTGAVGNISVATVGVNVIYLYSPYTGTGGAGLDYTMRATPGWAGTAGGGYSTSPLAILQDLMFANQAEQKNALIGAFTMIINPKFWGAMFDILTWQWSFMADYTMFYWIFLFPFVAMGLLCILLLVYGVVTGNLSW